MAGAPIPNAECRSDCLDATTSVATTALCLDDGTPIAVVVTRGCDGAITEDGWLDLTTGIFTAGPPPPGTSACTTDNYDFAFSGWLCDILPDGSVAGIALVQIERDDDGAVISITLIGVDGLPYVPVGTMTRCPEDRLAAEVLCDAGAANTPFMRFYTYSPTGSIPIRDTDLDGNPYVVAGPAVQCVTEIDDSTPIDVNVTNTPLVVSDGNGSITVDGTVDVGNWRDDAEFAVLCDLGAANTAFIRRYDVDDTGVVSVTDTNLDGTTPYVVVGPVGICPVSGSVVVSSLPEPVSVDDNGGSLTVDGTVSIDNTTGDRIRMGRERLNGAGATWTFASTGGGRIRSVTVVCLDDGVAGGPGAGSDVSLTDGFGNTFNMNTGQTFTWSTDAVDDELVDGGTFAVTLGAGGANAYVDVLWTEVL